MNSPGQGGMHASEVTRDAFTFPRGRRRLIHAFLEPTAEVMVIPAQYIPGITLLA